MRIRTYGIISSLYQTSYAFPIVFNRFIGKITFIIGVRGAMEQGTDLRRYYAHFEDTHGRTHPPLRSLSRFPVPLLP
jgi:hypothetical protein